MFDSEVLALYSFHSAFKKIFEFGYGAAVSLVLVIVALLFSFCYVEIFLEWKKMLGSSKKIE
ncbi:hypothetical protein GCM10020331_050960 [Ectobacillus funiculus]